MTEKTRNHLVKAVRYSLKGCNQIALVSCVRILALVPFVRILTFVLSEIAPNMMLYGATSWAKLLKKSIPSNSEVWRKFKLACERHLEAFQALADTFGNEQPQDPTKDIRKYHDKVLGD